MLLKLKTGIFLILLYSYGVSMAQPSKGRKFTSSWRGTIEGTVIDSITQAPIQFATVKLLDNKGKFINGIITNEKGKYTLDTVPAGMYSIQVDFMGYKTKKSNLITLSEKDNLLIKVIKPISLVSTESKTGTVRVSAKKDMLVNEIDKKVFNADDNITAAGGTAQDLLANVPSVVVDQVGNISLRGNTNVIILIDGRPSGLTGAGRQAFLESIPASSVERIEIITNPSAKYDPDGTSGIINIILKKNKLKGSNGMVSASLGTNNNYNFASQLGYRTSKVNVFGNYSLNIRNRVSSANYDKTTFAFNEVLEQNRLSTSQDLNHLVKVGADFYINKLNTIYFSANSGFGGGDRNNTGYYNYNFPTQNNAFTNLRTSEKESDKKSFDINVGYLKKFNQKNHELSTDIFFTSGERGDYDNLEQGAYDTTLQEFNTNQFYQNVNTDNNRREYSFKLDYTKPLKANTKLETGAKIDLRNLSNKFYAETTDTGSTIFTPNINLNNNFDYQENIFAAYGIVGKTIKKVGVQAGLRAEQAVTTSTLIAPGYTPVKNNYFSLFPSAHIKYNVTKAKTLMVSYSRRVNRPRTRQLNPFANSTDPEKVYTGNPYLKPEYISSYELGYSQYTKKYNFSTTLYWKHLTNMVSRIKTTDSTGLSAVTYDNFDESNSYGLEAIAVLKPIKEWNVVLSANANASIFKPNADQAGFDNSTFKWNGRMINTFKLKKNHSIQVTAFYRAPFDIPQGEILAMYGIDLGYTKKLWNNRATLGFRVTDIFNTQGFGYNTKDNFIEDNGRHKWQSQNAYINFAYNFGSIQKEKRKSRGGGGFDGGDMGM